eukprot:SAG25_NODE_3372_length_1107_cov_1.257937_1_plen_132_part_00
MVGSLCFLIIKEEIHPSPYLTNQAAIATFVTELTQAVPVVRNVVVCCTLYVVRCTLYVVREYNIVSLHAATIVCGRVCLKTIYSRRCGVLSQRSSFPSRCESRLAMNTFAALQERADLQFGSGMHTVWAKF